MHRHPRTLVGIVLALLSILNGRVWPNSHPPPLRPHRSSPPRGIQKALRHVPGGRIRTTAWASAIGWTWAPVCRATWSVWPSN